MVILIAKPYLDVAKFFRHDPGIVFVVLTASLYAQAFSGFIDVYSHRFIFVDEDPVFLNPAHIGIFISTALAIYTSYILKPLGVGINIVFYGVIIELLSGILNEFFHVTIGDLSPVSPPHALLVIGMIISQIGLIIASYTSRNPVNRVARISALSLLWTTGMGSATYVSIILADRGFIDLSIYVLALVTGLAVGAYISITPIGGIVSSVATYYMFNQIPIAFMTGIVYIPLPIIAGIIFEGLKLLKVESYFKVLIAGALSIAMVRLIHYPFLEHWINSIDLEVYVISIAVGVISSYIGLIAVKYIGLKLRLIQTR